MQSLPKIQPNLMSILTEFRDVYGFNPMQQSWEEHLRGDAMDPDQVDDMMTSDIRRGREVDESSFEKWAEDIMTDYNSACCDAKVDERGFCSKCGEHA